MSGEGFCQKCACRTQEFVSVQLFQEKEAEIERLREQLREKASQKQAVEDENDKMLMALKAVLPLCDGAIKGGYVRQYTIVRDIEQVIKAADPDFYYSEVLNRPTAALSSNGEG